MMSKLFIKYDHHGKDVYVQSNLKGLHKQHCLCYSCEKFYPNTQQNCIIAQSVFEINVKYGITSPVWECPEFEKRENE